MIFNNVIIFLNKKCDVGCENCNVNASISNERSLSKQDLLKIFKIHSDFNLPNFFTWTGGEPFLSFEELIYGVTTSNERGISSEILTSGSWFRENRNYLKELREAGKFSLRISIDEEHQKIIPFKTVLDLTGYGLDLGIKINFTLREIPGQKLDLTTCKDKILQKFPKLRNKSRCFHYIPHFSTQPADGGKTKISGNQWKEPCKIILRDLVIGNDGNIYPCCGIFQKPDFSTWALANIDNIIPDRIDNTFDAIPDLRVLQGEGPYGILKRDKIKVENLNWSLIKNPCDLCFALWNSCGN